MKQQDKNGFQKLKNWEDKINKGERITLAIRNLRFLGS